MARAIVMPSTGMYTAEGKLVTWLRSDGATVSEGDAVAEVETEKALFEIEAPRSGILHHVSPVGTILPVEGVLGYIVAEGEELPAPSASIGATASPPSVAVAAPPSDGHVRATPLAKRLAAERHVDLALVEGTGPGGRIVEADVLAAAAAPQARLSQPDAVAVRQRVPMSGMRRTIAERMRHSLSSAASLTLTREVRAEALVSAHDAMRRAGHDISYDAIFVKLLALALHDHRGLNSTVENDAIVIFDDINIGFAVSVEEGLLAPVVRHADRESLAAIAAAVRDLSRRAREGRLRPPDLANGTASITNLGAYGVDGFTPILNPPQSVILGIGRIAERPTCEPGRIVAAPTVVLSLTFDHRVADGVPAAQLLGDIAQRITDREFLEQLVQS